MDFQFNSIYLHGFIRAAVCVPFLKVAAPDYNTNQTLALARRASKMNAAVVLFPELGLSAYSNEDLFHQDALLDATRDAVARIVTESQIGPYELQDFNLYYITRLGYRPSKVVFLSHSAWRDRSRGFWPELIPEEKRNEYDLSTIKKWMGVFLYRFFKISQFKRSALPNAPKVGSGGSLSPRGDWRAPSDSEADIWLDELERNVPG